MVSYTTVKNYFGEIVKFWTGTYKSKPLALNSVIMCLTHSTDRPSSSAILGRVNPCAE